MAWSSNKTWTANSVLAAADLNTYLRDQLNALGAMYGIKQTQSSAPLGGNLNTVSATLADATGLSISGFSTTGGRVRIALGVGPTYSALTGYISAQGTSTNTNGIAEIVAVVNGTALGGQMLAIQGHASDAPSVEVPASSFVWDYQPAAPLSSVIVKIQFRVQGANQSCNISQNILLMVQEYGLVSA